ncbi:MAG: replication-relaxation family protein [Bacteriovorax sp.]|nr:replication-relaxation family protein [Bacteriovorax sp.]
MKYYYANGRLMSGYVAEALRHLGKVGVLSSRDWGRYFCRNKHRRWQERQLGHLRKSGYIKKHPASSLLGKWILDEKGKAFLYARNWSIVNPVPANHVDHDEFVARTLCEMEQASYIYSWRVERELKMMNQKDYMVSNKDGEMKFPDAVFTMQLPSGVRTIALEYERRGKSESRYRSILWNYSALTSISLVIFICEDESISRRIERALKHIGNTELFDRLAITSALEWKSSPLEAPIKMSRGVLNLKSVCLKFEERMAG